MFSKPSENTEGDSNSKQGKGPGCSVFGSGFLRAKASGYSELMGVSIRVTPEGHHEFSFDKNKLMTNAKKLMTELFNDLGIHPPMMKESE